MDKASELLVVVEDSDEDYYALHRAIQKACYPTQVIRCTDGDEALDFIHKKVDPANLSSQSLAAVLLDLNLFLRSSLRGKLSSSKLHREKLSIENFTLLVCIYTYA